MWSWPKWATSSVERGPADGGPAKGGLGKAQNRRTNSKGFVHSGRSRLIFGDFELA